MSKRIAIAVGLLVTLALSLCAGIWVASAQNAITAHAAQTPAQHAEIVGAKGTLQPNAAAADNITVQSAGIAVTDSDAPGSLAELQSADSAQLDYWAQNLTRFDGRDFGYITPTKNQFSYNICWAFAAVGAVEASILREGIDPNANKDNLDLDEYVAAYMRYNRDGQHDPLQLTTNDTFEGDWNKGANPHDAFAAMSQGYSLVDQTYYVRDEENIKNAVGESDYFLQSYMRIPNSTDEIKRAILQYGAVTFEYKAPANYTSHLYYADGKSTNHASIIVGWDDNASRNNFTPNKPDTDGAWIVKNSWGNYGYDNDGVYCYYLSYESYIGGNIYAVDMAMKQDYQNLYYYDGQLAASNRNYAAQAQAAIYEAKLSGTTVQEQLKAVVLMSPQSDLTVTIDIYKNLQVNPGNVNDPMNNPVQGKPAASLSASLPRMGLHTIDLDEPLDLAQGEYFSIVVSCRSAYDFVPLVCAADGNTSVNDMTYHMYDGQWYSYKAGATYADASTDNMSARIRAVTNTVPRQKPLDNDLQYARVEIANRLLFYAQGKQLVPDITVYLDGKLLSASSDYTVSIEDNSTLGRATIKIVGTGNYSGTRITYFEIAKPKWPPNAIANNSTIDVYADVTRLHDVPIPDGWEWIDQDRDLEFGRSYFAVSIKYVGDDKDFYQLNTCDFYVNRLEQYSPDKTDISGAQVTVDGRYTYNGSPIVPTVTVTLQGQQLTAGVDYTLSCTNNTNAGRATVTAIGKGKYSGRAMGTFEIAQAERPKQTPSSLLQAPWQAQTLSDVPLDCPNWYWQQPSTPIGDGLVATAVYKGGDSANYRVTEAQITVTRPDRKQLAQLDVLQLAETQFVYDGTDKTPEVTAQDGTYALRRDVDYTVEYVGNRNAGSGAAVVSGIGGYCGNVTLAFTIDKAHRSEFAASLSDWTYGDDNVPQPQLYGMGESADVTYMYGAGDTFARDLPTDAGNYVMRATIAESANYYSAECVATFAILPRDVHDLTIDVQGEYVYCGQAICPSVSVRFGKTELTIETDYTADCSNNVNAGKAVVEIVGRGNYAGTVQVTFEIRKAPYPDIETTVYVDTFADLSDIELPTDLVWDEQSLVRVSDNVFRANALYVGDNYDVDKIQFEIVVKRQEGGSQDLPDVDDPSGGTDDEGNGGEGDPNEPSGDKADASKPQRNDSKLLWLLLPAAAVVAAGVGVAIALLRRKR